MQVPNRFHHSKKAQKALSANSLPPSGGFVFSCNCRTYMNQQEFYQLFDSCYDEEGYWTGPKYWSSPVLLNECGDYVVYHYKRDDVTDETPVELGPEPWNPAPVSVLASCQSTDALIDRAEQLEASIKTDGLPPILVVRA